MCESTWKYLLNDFISLSFAKKFQCRLQCYQNSIIMCCLRISKFCEKISIWITISSTFPYNVLFQLKTLYFQIKYFIYELVYDIIWYPDCGGLLKPRFKLHLNSHLTLKAYLYNSILERTKQAYINLSHPYKTKKKTLSKYHACIVFLRSFLNSIQTFWVRDFYLRFLSCKQTVYTIIENFNFV